MLLVWFAKLLSSLIHWLDPHYLHRTELPRSSTSLASALELPRPKSELLLENALLRRQLIFLHRQAKKPHFTHSDRLSLLLLERQLRSGAELGRGVLRARLLVDEIIRTSDKYVGHVSIDRDRRFVLVIPRSRVSGTAHAYECSYALGGHGGRKENQG